MDASFPSAKGRRSSSFVVILIVACGSFHFGNVVSEIEHYLNGQLGRILVVEVVDILLNLEAIVCDGLATLTKGLFHKRTRRGVDVCPKAQLNAADIGSNRVLGSVLPTFGINPLLLPEAFS